MQNQTTCFENNSKSNPNNERKIIKAKSNPVKEMKKSPNKIKSYYKINNHREL
jgi:hypothetical protein